MGSLILSILLVIGIIAVSGLLIGVYIVVPIIGWLVDNPIAGVGLLVILCGLVGALVYNLSRD